MKIEELKKYKDKAIAIAGFWKEGKSALSFLKKLDFTNITILDKNKIIEQQEGIKYIDNHEYLDNLDQYELIIKSPGISPYWDKLISHRDKIVSPVWIFCSNYKGKIIWITGTKGKSTASTLLYATLQNAWLSVTLVWNIWNPVLDEINILEQEIFDYVVFEISSYMLEDINPEFYIGYLNNLYDCHLDWHHWKTNYANAKINILRNASIKISNIEASNFTQDLAGIIYFWEKTNYNFSNDSFLFNNKNILNSEKIALQWDHNKKNIAWILAILDQLADNWENIRHLLWSLEQTLSTFVWLPHRIENIWTYRNITFIDDAIATTPESTIAAIKTFEYNIWTIILWWEDSWFNFDKLRNIISTYNIKNIILFPDTWIKIFPESINFIDDTINNILNENNSQINIYKTLSMDSAIEFAYNNTEPWKICLLSTASPSFSIWNSYLQKAEQFQIAVKKYSG